MIVLKLNAKIPEVNSTMDRNVINCLLKYKVYPFNYRRFVILLL